MAAITETHLPGSNALAARVSVVFAGVAETQEKPALYHRALRKLTKLSLSRNINKRITFKAACDL